MKVFTVKFGNNLSGAEKLFVKGGRYDPKSEQLYVAAGDAADFESFFNLLPHPEYTKYCGLNKAVLEIKADGKYRTDIFERLQGGECRTICSCECDGDSLTEVDLTANARGDYTFFKITALTDCTLHSGAWLAGKPAERQVKTAVIICTYRREGYVSANMMRMADALAAQPEWREKLHFFIVDNACTLELESGGFYTVIKNRNLGGSGGFARGMYEAAKDPSFTHLLLMDDDIYFDFNVLERTCNMLALLTEEHKNASVGGAMLVLERPWMQYEFGGRFDGLIFRSLNCDLDVRKPESLIKNEHAPTPNYNAWWYCCMPADCVKKYGLPMPFFIKGDDVEYGLRTIDELILTSGLAVWHQSFENKYTGTLEYYIKRNGAIVAALGSQSGGLKAAIRFAYFMFKNLALKNYDCVELIYRAYRDFKSGGEFFLTADSEKVNEELRAHSQKFAEPAEIEAICGGKPQLKKPKVHKRHSLFDCMLIIIENYMPAFLFSAKPGVTSAGLPRTRDCFMKRTCVQYDEVTGRGLVFTLDKKRRRKLRGLTFRVFFGMLFGYRKIKKQYKKNMAAMCSARNWERMFFPDTKEGK